MNEDREIVLEAKDIAKSFDFPTPFQVLKKISLILRRGESIAIMGRSGAGKSTLLHILGTLDQPSKGTLWIAGKECFNNKISLALLRNEEIGFIFQNFNLLEEYTVLENILMPAKIGRAPIGKESKKRKWALELLKRVHLEEKTSSMVRQLSGGEKQRVAIARALCNDPALILADEPSGSLDRHNAEEIHSLLISLAKEMGKGLVIATHSKELAKLCDQTLILEDGVLQ